MSKVHLSGAHHALERRVFHPGHLGRQVVVTHESFPGLRD
jgi:hypothetical protein